MTPAASDARHRIAAVLPLQFPDSQYIPVAFGDIPGWGDDDQLAAFNTFRASCKAISARAAQSRTDKALGGSLVEPCHAARAATVHNSAQARAFFESHFLPIRLSRLGETDGFLTGYYEPIVDGSPVRTDEYTVPVYRRPSNLFVRGYKQSSGNLPNKGQVFRKIGRRKLVPYYDRGEIEDGAIAGRGLELCWLKNQTDLLFMQIQGSARVRFPDGTMMRLNYDAHNGYPYTAVGRVLIDRNIIPKEQMSMQRIRQWMEENPDAAKEVRRMNRSYVFFREVKLSDKDEAVGAQGVPLTPGRSIAVDKGLHVYGTPFFIEGDLPLQSEQTMSPFRRLMVAQDTGSAIVGPARADLYFGAGADAGKVSGRIRHPARFVMLVPRSLDPVRMSHTMPLPEARPSAKIAKLYPQTAPAKDDAKAAVVPVSAPVPLPPSKTPDAGAKSSGTIAAGDKAAVSATPPAKSPSPGVPAAAQPARPEVKRTRPLQRRRHRHHHHHRSHQ